LRKAEHGERGDPAACRHVLREPSADPLQGVMSNLPYRSAATPPLPTPPTELTYVAREREVNRATPRLWIRIWLFGLCGGGCVAGIGTPWAGLVIMVVVVTWAVLSWRRTQRGESIVFRVDYGELTVTSHGTALLARLPLARLDDVTLDTKAIVPATQDTSTAAAGVVEMKARGEVDVARIVLLPSAPREPLALTKEHGSHMDAVDGAGRIRTFLRAHGWVPVGERANEQ
jgi:hypothetical protein